MESWERFLHPKVNDKKLYRPVYRQLMSEIENGFLLLDKESRSELVRFVKKQQHKSGAFTNRTGKPDLYYTLFGSFILGAIKNEDMHLKLTQHLKKVQIQKNKVVDKFSFLLTRLLIDEDTVKKPSVFVLVRWIFSEGKNLNNAYRFFLFMLSFDAFYGKNRLLYFIVGTLLNFYRPQNNLPCSFFSALLLAKTLTGKKVERETKELYRYFETGKGFKAFKDHGNADLLSTGVSLFALKITNTDLRIVAPDCLNLVQENYDNGAFLSGDGDFSRDLEYTFYGLLTLGTLSKI